MTHNSGSDKRQSFRIKKQFSLTYKINGAVSGDTTFIKDISKGGIKFTASQPIPEKTTLSMDLSIPFMAPNKVTFEGIVVGVKSIGTLIHEIRVKFVNLSADGLKALETIEQQNKGAR